MNNQLVNDFMNLKSLHRERIQRELNVTFHQGEHESLKDFTKRLLTEVDNQGKIRTLEILLMEVS